MDGQVLRLPVEAIEPDPGQPRRRCDPEGLRELARSIQRDGLQQFPVVRPKPGAPGRWVLVAGERRWRAARLAGLRELPCVVREVDAERAFELAVLENECRQGLDPLEQAEAFARLAARLGSLEAVAARVHKPVAYVEYRVRLLGLRPEYREALRQGLLSLPQAADLARVPAPAQPRVFALYRRGVDPNRVARLISALVEAETQPELPVDPGEARRAADRLGPILERVAAELGRCWDRRELELLGWALEGPIDRHLALVGALIAQLRQLQEALRRAQGRRAVRHGEEVG